jgi:hypothetical protein
MGPVIVVSLVAHHTPTLNSFNGTSWVNMDFLQTGTCCFERLCIHWVEYLLFWEVMYLLSWVLAVLRGYVSTELSTCCFERLCIHWVEYLLFWEIMYPLSWVLAVLRGYLSTELSTCCFERLCIYWVAYLLFWEVMHPLTWNEFSLQNRMSVGCVSPSCTPRRHQLTDLINPASQFFVIEFVNHSCLKWIYYLLVFCRFSYCLEWNLLLENFPHVSKLLSEFTWHFLSHLYSACVSCRMCIICSRWLTDSVTSNRKQPARGRESITYQRQQKVTSCGC